jgi:hypothetical protein
VKISLANPEPSTHGTYETFTEGRIKTAISLITDIAEAFTRLARGLTAGKVRPEWLTT